MRTNEACPVCHGTGKIRFAVVDHGLAVAVFEEWKNPRPTTITQRDYPCPECATPQNKIAIAQGRAEISTGYNELPAKEHVAIAAKRAVQELVDFLVRENVFTFKTERGADGLSLICVAELGVVTDRFAELREGFVRNEVTQAVDRVAKRASDLIQVWGSATRYASDRIEKSRALEFIAEARKDYMARKGNPNDV